MRNSFVYIKYELKYFIHNCQYLTKFRFRKAKKRNILYFIFEENGHHPGLADRIKAIISLYNVAKGNRYQFKVFFETPFVLADYLHPRIDWVAHMGDLEYSLFDTKIINETNWNPIRHLTPNKQYHCYCYAGNDIPWEFKDTHYKWHVLFQELFAPSKKLLKAYKELGILQETYVSVHLRFVNALEKFESTFFDNSIEDPLDKDKLIQKCKKAIKDICDENPRYKVCVFSDSKTFLDELDDMPVKVLNSNNIGHTSSNTSPDVQLKTFLDLFIMSKSKTIYRIRAKELYNVSCFALLAARIGNVPFVNKDI